MQLHALSKKPSRSSDLVAERNPPLRMPAGPREPSPLTGPHQMWVTDVSYAHIASCLVYTAAVIDAWSREIVGYAASLQITNRLARIALHSAVRAHRPAPGCLHHSTCGSQYFTRSYCELLRQYGLIPSNGDIATARYYSNATPSHQIVEMGGYTAWRDVVARPDEFIQTLYSAERIGAILAAQSMSEADPEGSASQATRASCRLSVAC